MQTIAFTSKLEDSRAVENKTIVWTSVETGEGSNILGVKIVKKGDFGDCIR
jgi:hypothetical protein